MLASAHRFVLGLGLVLAHLAAQPAAAAASTSELGKFFKVCSRSDPKVEECVVESLNAARDNIVKGVPSLALERLDPLAFREVRIEEGPAEFQLRLVVRNASLDGLAAFTATRAKVDFPGRYIEVEMLVPRLVLAGRYSFGGQILTLPINGNGHFDAIIGTVNLTNRIRFAEDVRDGVLHWKVVEYLWDMNMNELKVNFRNLFGGNKRLGQYANAFINRHWRPIYQIYKYLLTANVGYRFQDITNNMLARVPFDEMFKP